MAADTFIAFTGAERRRLENLFTFELQAEAQGFARVAGVDEAGRGPLAGPLVAAAVVLREPLAGLDDSKRLSETRREHLYDALHAGGAAIGLCVVEPAEIDTIGIQQANYAAMLRAVEALVPKPDLLLIDGFHVPGTPLPQWRLIKGDRRSLSIAAASIVAKVTRDRIMRSADENYPGYLFAKHKGYATQEHLARLAKHGPCPLHRRSFAPLASRLKTGTLFDLEKEKV